MGKFSWIIVTAGMSACLLPGPSVAATPPMASNWGNQITSLLNQVMDLAQDPSQSARVNMGLSALNKGAELGSEIGGNLVGWAAGDEYQPVGKVLGMLLGANLAQTSGESIVATIDQAHNFLAQDQALLVQIDNQLGQLASIAQSGSTAAAEIAGLDSETDTELDKVNGSLASWYIPATIAAIRPQIPVLANNAEALATHTDALTKELDGE